MRILGIDPGTSIVGYGAVDFTAPSTFEVVTYGTIQTPPHTPLQERLVTIFADLQSLLQELQPDVMSIEKLFFFRNVSTAMPVAHARGVMMLAATLQQVTLAEYTPLEIKQTLTGYGRATKQEIQAMTAHLLQLERIPRPDDAADALAIAICHANHCL